MAPEKRIINENLIMTVLAKQPGPTAPNRILESLLRDKKVLTHKAASTEKKVHVQRQFGRHIGDFPKMESDTPLKGLVEAVQSAESLDGMLVDALSTAAPDAGGCFAIVKNNQDIGGETSANGYVSAHDKRDAYGIPDDYTDPRDLLEKVSTGEVYVRNLPCTTVESKLKAVVTELEQQPGVVHVEGPTCSVLPPGHLLGLGHNAEGTHAYTTILNGEMVWVLWPPTAHNLEILQQGYQKKAAGSQEETKDVVRRLEGGVIVGHRAGERLHMPPLCIYVCIPTEFTVLAMYKVLSATDFIDSLRIPANFYRLWLASHGNPEEALHLHSETLVGMIRRILDGDFDTYRPVQSLLNTNTASPIRYLIQIWDGVKADVAQLLTPDHSKMMRDAWVRMLSTLRSDECPICGTRTTHFEIADSHFDEVHWSRAIQETPTVLSRHEQFSELESVARTAIDKITGGATPGDVWESETAAAEEDFTDLSLIDPRLLYLGDYGKPDR